MNTRQSTASEVIFVTDRFYREIDIVYDLHDAIADYQDNIDKLRDILIRANNIDDNTNASILSDKFYRSLRSLVSDISHTSISYSEDCDILQDTLDHLQDNISEDRTYKEYVNRRVKEYFSDSTDMQDTLLEVIEEGTDTEEEYDPDRNYSNLVHLVYVRDNQGNYDPGAFRYFSHRPTAYEFACLVEVRLNDKEVDYDNVYVCGMSEDMAIAIVHGDLDPEFDSTYAI